MKQETEEAKRLVDRFEIQLQKLPNTRWRGELDLASKQCALIAVDEILENQYDYIPKATEEYWQRVKEAINNLK